jgi:hypothetical protein
MKHRPALTGNSLRSSERGFERNARITRLRNDRQSLYPGKQCTGKGCKTA